VKNDDYDTGRVDDAVLALLWLNAVEEFGANRAWKSFDWEAMNRLHAQGLIDDPRSKDKSVLLTEAGARQGHALFERLFASPAGAGRARLATALDGNAALDPSGEGQGNSG